jgi:hypothetical protein
LFSPQAVSIDEVSLSGVCYGIANGSGFRNSKIMFQPFISPSTNSTHQKAGLIQSIFHYQCCSERIETNNFYLLVCEYIPMTSHHIIFQEFGFAGGFLCEPVPRQLHIIELTSAISHFVLTKLVGEYDDCIHVLPVDQVRNIVRGFERN